MLPASYYNPYPLKLFIKLGKESNEKNANIKHIFFKNRKYKYTAGPLCLNFLIGVPIVYGSSV
jgi:hypothetical protein